MIRVKIIVCYVLKTVRPAIPWVKRLIYQRTGKSLCESESDWVTLLSLCNLIGDLVKLLSTWRQNNNIRLESLRFEVKNGTFQNYPHTYIAKQSVTKGFKCRLFKILKIVWTEGEGVWYIRWDIEIDSSWIRDLPRELESRYLSMLRNNLLKSTKVNGRRSS